MKVKGNELGPVVKNFVNIHDVSRPLHTGKGAVRAAEYIQTRSGISPERLKEIIECNREYWDFSVADKLLCAIDRQDALVNGEINIYSNEEVPKIRSNSLCECGCGEFTTLVTVTRRTFGLIKGQPRRYIKGHHNKMRSKT